MVHFGGSIPGDASPAELVKRFFKESKDLLKQLAALPTPAKSPANAASAEREVPRPALAGGREGEVKPATDAEAKQAADDSALKIETSLVIVPVSVLDRDGKIAYKSTPGPFGFKPAELEPVLADLLGASAAR